MLTYHACGSGQSVVKVALDASSIPHEVTWIDAESPTPEERAFLQRTLSVELPPLEALAEIETSSRLRVEDEVLFLSIPLIVRDKWQPSHLAPVGFILSQDRLITVHYEPLASFEDFAQHAEKIGHAPRNGLRPFLGLMEAIVDRIADGLENIAAELDAISHRIFANPKQSAGDQKRTGQTFRVVLRRVGQISALTTNIRSTLLGIGRAAPFVNGNADWLDAMAHTHIEAIRQDIASLNEFEGRTSEKVQFLLDATLGFINMDQNDIFKVLTIVSVIGIPPTLLASIYGMNFKNMPELNWEFGYPFGLTMIALSALVPAVWFKIRGWF